MTNEEAYDWLNQAEYLDLTEGDSKDYKAIAMAKYALEKQIINGWQWTPIASDKKTFKCPVCSNYVVMQFKSDKCNYEYCPHCGQKIGE